jgi:hypothetical protein
MAMPPENMTRAIWNLTGQVHALFLACQAMAKSHANSDLVLTQLEKAQQEGLASLENLPINDAILIGYQHALGGLLDAIKR